MRLVNSELLLFSVYAPDMPKRLPIRDLVIGLLHGILRAVRYWLHYTLVALAWLGIVPLTACKYTLIDQVSFYFPLDTK